jgi:hypothetical protein
MAMLGGDSYAACNPVAVNDPPYEPFQHANKTYSCVKHNSTENIHGEAPFGL